MSSELPKDNFTNEQIIEISRRLKWKPNKLSFLVYDLCRISIFCIILILIYLSVLPSIINCKIDKEIQKISTENKNLTSNMTNNSNAIRYLITTSENRKDNRSLADKYYPSSVLFENERENPLLSIALNGS